MKETSIKEIRTAARHLQLSDLVLENLKVRPETCRECRETLDLCWKWLAGDKVGGDDIGQPLEEVSPNMDTYFLFPRESPEDYCLRIINGVVGYFAKLAYDRAGEVATELICKFDADSLDANREFLSKLGYG